MKAIQSMGVLVRHDGKDYMRMYSPEFYSAIKEEFAWYGKTIRGWEGVPRDRDVELEKIYQDSIRG